MINIPLWNDFKNLVSSKNLSIQYTDLGHRYDIFAMESGLVWTVSIGKTGDDCIDFETNYKSYANQSNRMDIRPTSYNPLREWQSIGAKYTVIVPVSPEISVQNIFDFELSADLCGADGQLEVYGGRYFVKDAISIHDDDILEFSIIDKNDVLGLFSTYGLTVGIDILELKKFVKTHSVLAGRLTSFDPGQVKVVSAGLFLRTSYTSYNVGGADFSLKMDFILPS